MWPENYTTCRPFRKHNETPSLLPKPQGAAGSSPQSSSPVRIWRRLAGLAVTAQRARFWCPGTWGRFLCFLLGPLPANLSELDAGGKWLSTYPTKERTQKSKLNSEKWKWKVKLPRKWTRKYKIKFVKRNESTDHFAFPLRMLSSFHRRPKSTAYEGTPTYGHCLWKQLYGSSPWLGRNVNEQHENKMKIEIKYTRAGGAKATTQNFTRKSHPDFG